MYEVCKRVEGAAPGASAFPTLRPLVVSDVLELTTGNATVDPGCGGVTLGCVLSGGEDEACEGAAGHEDLGSSLEERERTRDVGVDEGLGRVGSNMRFVQGGGVDDVAVTTAGEGRTRVVWCSFDGRYSDSPRAMYEATRDRPDLEHTWLAHPAHRHTFPEGVHLAESVSHEARTVLEAADLVVASSHMELTWDKQPGSAPRRQANPACSVCISVAKI